MLNSVNTSAIQKLINLAEFEGAARQNMDSAYFDYYRGGSDDELTLRANLEGFQKIKLLHRVLAGCKEPDLSVTVLGDKISMPVVVAPTAMHTMAHPDGELATVKAVSEFGTLMCVSTISAKPFAQVAKAANCPLWMQLYILKDRGATRAMIELAREHGYKAIVLTADAPVLGVRERDVRNNLSIAGDLKFGNLEEHLQIDATDRVGGSAFANHFIRQMDKTIGWKDLEWVKEVGKLPVFIKGLVDWRDVKPAIEYGADGVVVSNHGGRQLDGGPGTIEVLPQIADTIAKHNADILTIFDGGIRRGTDVVKALLLGADIVQTGRPVLWGLAAGGQAGVAKVLQILRTEIARTMTLCGTSTIAELKKAGSSLIYSNG